MLPSLCAWIKVFERFDESPKKEEVVSKIKKDCLFRSEQVDGMYQVNSEKVWDELVEKNEKLKQRLFLTGITSCERLEWFYYDKIERYFFEDEHYQENKNIKDWEDNN